MDNNRKDNIWVFEDISSSSRESTDRRPDTAYNRPNTQRRPARSSEERRVSSQARQPREQRQQRRPSSNWEIPEWELSERNRRPRTSPERNRNVRRPESRREPPRKRAKKPMSRGARKALSSLIVLIMAAATALLAIFLLFKVTNIEVTGDVIRGYQNAQIIDICGYKTGDNLIFISTDGNEEKLKAQLPYVGEAKISRHLPGTIEINLTAARVSACIAAGGDWLFVSADGKILEKSSQPQADVLQISGLSPLNSQPGEFVKVEDDNAQTAYTTILTALAELDMSGDFTELNLADLSNITMLYQDRIEFRLGNILELKYKIDLGCRSVAELGTGEKGVMDLSYAGDTKRAVFTAGALAQDKTENQSKPENSSGDKPVSSQPENDRGDDIPDDIYTGDSTEDDTDYDTDYDTDADYNETDEWLDYDEDWTDTDTWDEYDAGEADE